MGFISSANTVTLETYLTQLGRNYLLTGEESRSKVKYFTLGDSDTNYLIAINENGSAEKNILTSGFVPDVTGDDTGCIKSVANGVGLKHRLKYVNPEVVITTDTGTTTTTTTNTGSTEPASRSLRIFTESTTINSTNQGLNDANIEVDLVKWFDWVCYTDTTNYLTNGRPSSPILDFYKGIRVLNYNSSGQYLSFEVDDVIIKPLGDTKQKFEFLNQLTYYKTNDVAKLYLSTDSCFQFLFSSHVDNNIKKYGAGAGGMLINTQEVGVIDNPDLDGDFKIVGATFPQKDNGVLISDTTKVNTARALSIRNRDLLTNTSITKTNLKISIGDYSNNTDLDTYFKIMNPNKEGVSEVWSYDSFVFGFDTSGYGSFIDIIFGGNNKLVEVDNDGNIMIKLNFEISSTKYPTAQKSYLNINLIWNQEEYNNVFGFDNNDYNIIKYI
jgi:hypothetical protein